MIFIKNNFKINKDMDKNMDMNEEELKKKLTPEQYKVLREKGTEAPFSGKYVYEKKSGTYNCMVCGNHLFASTAKFDSGTGWPSFDEALPGAVNYNEDTEYGMHRTEITCAQCGSHLGHVFEDGPTKTGKRYCLNSVCLDLEEGK
jgi:peptide-methionine (R)-S-oxide reductase